MIKGIFTTLLSLLLTLSAKAQFVFFIDVEDEKGVRGTIVDKINVLQVATFSLESDREGITCRTTQAAGTLRINEIYAAGQINEYTLKIEVTDANYKLESVLWGSSDAGNFSRGGGHTVIGISLDQEAKFIHTNPAYAAAQWSDNGGISSILARDLNGTKIVANSLLQTDFYIKQVGERGIWGLLTGGAPIQKFTYGEIGGSVLAALDSFEISVDFIQTKISEP